MNKLILLFVSLLFTPAGQGTQGDDGFEKKLGASVGSVLCINSDFDIYKIKVGSRKTYSFYYKIMPAPDVGIGGWEIAYLGRMPAGTQLEVVAVEKGRWFEKPSYWVKPISSINSRLKGDTSRKVHVSEANLDDQIYKLSSIASNVGLYEKGHYSNGAPRLNGTWFTLIKLNE